MVKKRLPVLILVLAAAVIACGWYLGWFGPRKHARVDQERIRQLVASEELILKLTPSLRRLARDLRNLDFPSDGNRDIFAERFAMSEPVPRADASENFDGLSTAQWESGPLQNHTGSSVRAWRAVLESVRWFDYASFKIERAEFTGDGDFLARVLFSASGKSTDGMNIVLKGTQSVLWQPEESAESGWKISRWEIGKFSELRSKGTVFRDRLDEALPAESARTLARTSEHRRALSHYYKTNKTRAPFYEFAPIAMSQKPAVSVVDIDGDGFDDIYLMVRLGRNILLRNQGDGTFAEEAAKWSLAIPGMSTCGIFADFDNDGDPDLMLGRSIERSAYLENTGSRFVAVPQEEPLPYLASSMAAADFNNDGLLDLYLCTYRRGDLADTAPGFGGAGEMSWADKYLGEKEAAEYRRRFEESKKATEHHGYLDQVGPRNVLLANRGEGRFERVFAGDDVCPWKNTLQAVWNDFDDDGDPDLFLAHDWAPDQLFRNDGGNAFVDISTEAGLTAMGFGMGASWGDYDNDGLDDIYVSNMFSKAGRRILGQFGETSTGFIESAEGNFLHRQTAPGRFTRVSGLKKGTLQVAQSGWSWGGQFVDFDNDRDLDIYALSGYFTAPPEYESEIDL